MIGFRQVWALCLLCWPVFLGAEPAPSYTTYGTPGVIEMPSATSPPDAELVGSLSYFEDNTRTTFAFQITPRLTGAFRYAGLEGLGGSLRDNLFDRSFDLHYRLLDAKGWRPAVAVGLRDFIGTGVYSAEYVVATKPLNHGLDVTAGVGWGRLGRSGYLSRAGPTASTNQGGQLEAARWFSGDPALFGGVTWQATRRTRVKLEYSSDSYAQEEADGAMSRRHQWNIGLDHRLSDVVSLQAFYLHGTRFGLAVHIANNPHRAKAPSGNHPAPFPVRQRGASRDLGWPPPVESAADARATLTSAMAREGLFIEGLRLTDTRAEVHIWNTRYSFAAEAVGRAARVLSQYLPGSVETFVIVNTSQGMPTSSVELQRSDLERFEHAFDGAEQIAAAAQIGEAPLSRAPAFDPALYPRFIWGLGPYLRTSYFDPDRPVMADLGLRLNAEYVIAPGVVLSGSVRKSLAGNFGDSERASNSALPKVRSESNRYLTQGDPALETLTLATYFRPGRNLYGRLTVGYLEGQYGGISAEVLWKPVDKNFALGAEINYVRQRDFDQGFGFRSYDVVTGHVSAYYALRNGFHAQVDVGRYLAGDWGGTITIDREFRNGWRVGAYATFTDVSFEDFGEGSFDKGLRVTIPLEPLLGKPSRNSYGIVLQPLTRDGGAKVQVNGRLYEQVRANHRNAIESSWGRFWR